MKTFHMEPEYHSHDDTNFSGLNRFRYQVIRRSLEKRENQLKAIDPERAFLHGGDERKFRPRLTNLRSRV